MALSRIPRPLGYAPAAIAAVTAVTALVALRRLWVHRRTKIKTDAVTPLPEAPEVLL